ncbi:MAG: DUF5666 domain-containing protein [Pseudomonadota bacterium]
MNPRKTSLILALSVAAAACGGGSGSDAPPPSSGGTTPPQSGGIGRTGLAVGPISNFGSVVVNGVRYDTSAATFTVDDMPGTEADLAVGQVVIVKGSIDADGVNGTADEVIYDDALEGPISAIDIGAGTITVLGQTVIIDAGTSFDDDFLVGGIEGLQVNDVIEVSGFVTSDGSIIATRIELDDDNDEFERKGIVESLDTSALTFNLGSLVVDYSAAVLEDFPSGDIADGNLVEAEGTIDPNDAGRLIASKIEFEDPLGEFDTDDDVELEGLVTRFVSETDFDVNGIPVTTDGDTEFENGAAADIGLDVRIEVEGEFTAGGTLLADEIDFRLDEDTTIEATVDAVDETAGTLTVLGISITTDALTRFEDQSSLADDLPLNLSDINVGDYLEIEGVESPANSDRVVATRIEREDDPDEVALSGLVDAVAEPTLTVLGVTIETNAETEFEGADDQPLTATVFFATVAAGAVIEVTGVESSDAVIIADEIEIEDDD